jgi:hypothetical protein
VHLVAFSTPKGEYLKRSFSCGTIGISYRCWDRIT